MAAVAGKSKGLVVAQSYEAGGFGWSSVEVGSVVFQQEAWLRPQARHHLCLT